MKRFNKLLCFMVVFIAVMVAFCTVSFAEGPFNWTSKTNMLTPVSCFASCSVKNNIYVFGGFVKLDGTETDKVQVYNTTNNTWSYKTSMPLALRSCYSVEIDGTIYVVGGLFSDNTSSSKLLAYNINTDTWNTNLADLPISLGGASLAVIDGKIYVLGGYNSSSGHQSSIYIYDPTSNTWVKNAVELTSPRQQMGISVIDGMVYVIGGWDANGPTSIVEMFNPKTNTWTSKSSLKIARVYAGSVTYKGNIYVLGGRIDKGWNATDIIEEYNIQSNTWINAGKLSYPRNYPGASLVANSIYIYGGSNNLNTMLYNTIEQNSFPIDTATLTATPQDKQVQLEWTSVENAKSYNVYRSLTSGGPYTKVAESINLSYVDNGLTNDTTYYYVVTAIDEFGNEGPYSNEASATPTAPTDPEPSGNCAILEITMVTGEIKEYDVTAAELQSFLTWYDGRSNGADKAYYMMPKKNNIKPFLSRKEYIAFDKISSFEVKEYKE